MGRTYRKSHWKETRKEPANLNQKGGPFRTRRRDLLEEAYDEELQEELDGLEAPDEPESDEEPT